MEGAPMLTEAVARRFDVICAGETTWRAREDLRGAGLGHGVGFRPGGGALNVAVMLAEQGLAVGLVSAVPDDRFGRALVARVASTGVDVDAVTVGAPPSLVLVDAASGHVTPRGELPAPVVPPSWSSSVLLLSGLAPTVEYGAAFCRAARAARRAGTTVVVDANARLHVWAGADGRRLRALLGEIDVFRCSTADLAVLGLDLASVRRAMRPDAVIVLGTKGGDVAAVGPFGEIVRRSLEDARLRPAGAGDTLTASLCAALLREGNTRQGAFWDRALAPR